MTRVRTLIVPATALIALLTVPLILSEPPPKQGGTPGFSAEGPASDVRCPDPNWCQ
jgi:hypothetical protein